MDLSPEVTNNMFDPVGVSIDCDDAKGVFMGIGGVTVANPDLVDVLVDPGGVSGVLVDVWASTSTMRTL